MCALEQLEQSPIKPIYGMILPGEAIDFGSVELLIPSPTNADSRTVNAHAYLRLHPRDSLELTVPAPAGANIAQSVIEALTRVGDDIIAMQLPQYGTSLDVFCKFASSEHSIYIPKISPVQVLPTSKSISKATFHVMNWPDFIGPDDYILLTGKPPLQGGKRCGRIILEFNGWRITIAAVDETATLVKSLGESGGYAITHVGAVERIDASLFSTEALDDLLVSLHYFFSFALGRWGGPCLAVGFDDSGKRVFEQWGLRQTAKGKWDGARSCFDAHHADFFAGILPGFSKRWNDDNWRRPLTEAIYWYISANDIGSGVNVDTALLFTQSALELLAWTYCVQDRKMVSANAFEPRGLSASDKLRLLASSMDIPIEIPSGLASLRSKPGSRWHDSMDAITDLRNGLVHPGKGDNVPEGTYYDAWRLSMWYIELVLLRLFEYEGNYANRLSQRWVGQVEHVPWNP